MHSHLIDTSGDVFSSQKDEKDSLTYIGKHHSEANPFKNPDVPRAGASTNWRAAAEFYGLRVFEVHCKNPYLKVACGRR